MSGASTSSVASEVSAVTSAASCVRAPAFRLTAVWLVPPPAGIAPNNPPTKFAAPIASNSRFGAGRGSSPVANARAAAMLSVKLMSAIPHAAGHRIEASAIGGRTSEGSPP